MPQIGLVIQESEKQLVCATFEIARSSSYPALVSEPLDCSARSIVYVRGPYFAACF